MPLLEAGADTIVLGCTHYPFLSETISKVAGESFPERSIEIIDPAPAVARRLQDVMKQEGIAEKSPEGYSLELYSSGDHESLDRMVRLRKI